MVLPRNPSLLSDDRSFGPSIVMNSSKSTWPSPADRPKARRNIRHGLGGWQNGAIKKNGSVLKSTSLQPNEIEIKNKDERPEADQQMAGPSTVTKAHESSALIHLLSNASAPEEACARVRLWACVKVRVV